jgi:hypothetical protein
MEKSMTQRLFNSTHRKDLCTESDLVEASKGIHDALKSTIPSMVKSEMTKLVGSILHKEMENRLIEVTKSYEDRLSEMRKSYETRLTDLQYSNDKNLKDIEDLVKSVSVPGATEDAGMEVFLRTVKMLDTKLEKRLDEVAGGFQEQLKTLSEGIISDLDTLKKSFEGEQGRLEGLLKSLPTPQINIPAEAIRIHVTQPPPVVQVGEKAFNIQLEQAPAQIIFDEKSLVAQVQMPRDSLVVNVQAKAILEESDRVTEKSITYNEATGRPDLIKEKTMIIPKN